MLFNVNDAPSSKFLSCRLTCQNMTAPCGSVASPIESRMTRKLITLTVLCCLLSDIRSGIALQNAGFTLQWAIFGPVGTAGILSGLRWLFPVRLPNYRLSKWLTECCRRSSREPAPVAPCCKQSRICDDTHCRLVFQERCDRVCSQPACGCAPRPCKHTTTAAANRDSECFSSRMLRPVARLRSLGSLRATWRRCPIERRTNRDGRATKRLEVRRSPMRKASANCGHSSMTG